MGVPPYALLALAIVSEVAGTMALKASDGMSRLGPAALVIVGYGVAFFLLAQVVKSVPVGVAYAIWAGAGITLVLIASAVLYRQMPDIAAVLGVALIIAGIVILQVFSKMSVD